MGSKTFAIRRILILSSLCALGCATGAVSPKPMVSEAIAVESAKEAAAARCLVIPFDRFEVAKFEIRSGAYHVVFELKERAMGGMIEVWVEGKTGKAVEVYCYP